MAAAASRFATALARHKVAVSSGLRDRFAALEEPGPGEETFLDGVRERFGSSACKVYPHELRILFDEAKKED